MSEPSEDTHRPLLPKTVVSALLIILVAALLGGYLFGLRGRAPEPGDRPAGESTTPSSESTTTEAFSSHQSFRQAFERGEAGPQELESWLDLLRGLSHQPEWQVAYMRLLIENSRYDEALSEIDNALSDDAYLAAADAALINGEPERLDGWHEEVSSGAQLPSLSDDPVASPRYRAVERALLEVNAALDANDEVGALRRARDAIASGAELIADRPPLYGLVEGCSGRPEDFEPALELLRRDAQADPSNAIAQAILTRALILKATAHLALLQYQGAATALEEASRWGFDRAEVLYYQTIAFEIEGDHEAALEVVSQGLDELSVLFEYVNARVLLKLGRVSDARDAIERWHGMVDEVANAQTLMGRTAYRAAEQLRHLLNELIVCGGFGTGPSDETLERGLMLGSDRFRCEFLSEAAPFRRWFVTAFEAPQARSDDDLSLALLALWTLPIEEQEHVLARRSSHFLGIRRELIRAHLRYLFSARFGDEQESHDRWNHVERLRTSLLRQ